MPDPDKETATWKASAAWTQVRIEGDKAFMVLSVFEGLGNYSCTVPSGVYIGKRWRRLEEGAWWMGEYAENKDPDLATIIWREIYVNPDVPEGAYVRATETWLKAHAVEKALRAS